VSGTRRVKVPAPLENRPTSRREVAWWTCAASTADSLATSLSPNYVESLRPRYATGSSAKVVGFSWSEAKRMAAGMAARDPWPAAVGGRWQGNAGPDGRHDPSGCSAWDFAAECAAFAGPI